MKRNLLAICIAMICGLSVNAQNLKFGHIDSQKLLELMPQRDSATKVLSKEYKDMEGIMQDMQVEFNKKYQVYMEKQDSLGTLAKKTKEEELQQLQERIQNYQQTAQQDLQKREAELLKPIMDKAKKAIEEVAKENGFLYVFDISGGLLLYYSEKSVDITALVKKKLGIPENAVPASSTIKK
jgi:outer membrane protein